MYNLDGSAIKVGDKTNLTKTTNSFSNSMMQLSLDYANSFGRHNVKGLLLYEEGTRKGDGFWVQRVFDLDALDELFAGLSTDIQGNSTDIFEYTNIGW